MVAAPPGHRALLARRTALVRLAFNAQVHDVIPADGTVVDLYVPTPHGHRIPLLDLEPLLGGCRGGCCKACIRCRSVHVHVHVHGGHRIWLYYGRRRPKNEW